METATANKRKCRSCISWILKRRLGLSSPKHLVYSWDRVIVMLMILENHRVGILRSSILVVIDESLFKKVRIPKMFSQQNKLKIWLYWFQSKRISMPWIVITKHVISCSGSVWNGLRCNRWIASNDFFRKKLIKIESQKKDLIRPRTKQKKTSESAWPTNALGSIVLLLSMLKFFINNMFYVIYDSCNMLHWFDINKVKTLKKKLVKKKNEK